MTTITRNSHEFSCVKKRTYGVGSSSNDEKTSSVLLGSKLSTPSSLNANLEPHRAYYGKDQDGSDAYFIEFNVGNFEFDEVSIRTEGHTLYVEGNSKTSQIKMDFKRKFQLPQNVDQFSIKAQLDESTRQLTLIGSVNPEAEKRESTTHVNAEYSFSSGGPAPKIGSITENHSAKSLDYTIFLGNELKDGQVTIEITGYNTLIVRVNKNDWDKNGDFSLNLNRQIKLPAGANPQNIEHGINTRNATLLIKVPTK